MKVVFENAITEDLSCKLTVQNLTENCISIKVSNYNFNTKLETDATHYLNKKDLSEFIGSLLHLQSSLKRSR